MNNTAYIIGTGSYLPDYIVTNEEMAGITGLSPHDIKKKTGIIERRRADKDEATSDLATKAALSALKSAGVAVEDVGLIVLSTTSPEMFMPSTACLVQRNIGAKKAAAFDVKASCSGFIYSLNIAEMFIRGSQTNTALVIAAEVKSRFVNPRDKETAILFGDGAGAGVLRGGRGGFEQRLKGKIIGPCLYANGTHWNWIHLPAGGSRMPASPATIAADLHTMRMDGSKVYKAAIKTLSRMKIGRAHV